jgi:sortase A
MARRLLRGLGRVLIAAGTLVLLFVAYQVWGTGLHTASAQRALDDEYERLAARYDRLRAEAEAAPTSPSTAPPSTPPPTAAPTTTAPARPAPAIPPPREGELVGQVTIPRIGLDGWKIVQGVSVRQLKRGVGHYPRTPLPGQEGNAALAGHRTTYGAPFQDIDDLRPGDEVVVETLAQGRFRYEVTGTRVVSPSEVSVLADQGDDRLTLTACDPKYSARRRIVVSAELAGEPVPPLPGQAEAAATTPSTPDGAPSTAGAGPDDLDGEPAARGPTVLWAAVAATIWLAAWAVARFVLAGRRRAVRWSPYAVGLIPFLLALYLCFENVARLLPASY